MNSDRAAFQGARVIEPTVRGVTIGRLGRAQVALEHPSVSPRHAIVMLHDKGVLVCDLKSRNGTFVGRRRVERAILESGQAVSFGTVEYRVVGRRLECLDAEADIGLAFRVDNLSVTRNSARLLEGISLDTEPGQFVGILGLSGSGKSTLLKCLAGYVPPEANSRVFAGHWSLPADVAEYRRHVGYVPQDDTSLHGLTVRENLDYALRLRGDLGRRDRASLVDGMLSQLRLTRVADNLAGTLSGGERRRLNVGAELLGRPRVLFLDEPTAGLDPASERDLMQQLREIAGQGVTVFCATHVLGNLELFDRLLVLAHRRVDFSGPPKDLLPRYNVTTYPDLYRHLEKGQARSSPSALRPVKSSPAPPPSAPARVRPPETAISLAAQVRVLMSRGLKLIGRDPLFAWLLVLQPLVIGLLINLSQCKPTSAVPILTFVAATATWLGLNNTARELVRERKIYVRERLLGVTPVGYLVSKVALFAGIGLVQVASLVAVVLFMSFMDPRDGVRDDLREVWFCQLVLVNWAAYLSALLLGLTISALAKTEEFAVAWLPLIVLPQLLISSAATGLDEQSPRSGHFRSLPLLARQISRDWSEPAGSPRIWPEYALDFSSLFLYARPAVSAMHRRGIDKAEYARWMWTDVAHSLVLLVGTAGVLAVVFRRRDNHWLENA